MTSVHVGISLWVGPIFQSLISTYSIVDWSSLYSSFGCWGRREKNSGRCSQMKIDSYCHAGMIGGSNLLNCKSCFWLSTASQQRWNLWTFSFCHSSDSCYTGSKARYSLKADNSWVFHSCIHIRKRLSSLDDGLLNISTAWRSLPVRSHSNRRYLV